MSNGPKSGTPTGAGVPTQLRQERRRREREGRRPSAPSPKIYVLKGKEVSKEVYEKTISKQQKVKPVVTPTPQPTPEITLKPDQPGYAAQAIGRKVAEVDDPTRQVSTQEQRERVRITPQSIRRPSPTITTPPPSRIKLPKMEVRTGPKGVVFVPKEEPLGPPTFLEKYTPAGFERKALEEQQRRREEQIQIATGWKEQPKEEEVILGVTKPSRERYEWYKPVTAFSIAKKEGPIALASLIGWEASTAAAKAYPLSYGLGLGAQVGFGAKGLKTIAKIESAVAKLGTLGLGASAVTDPYGTLRETPSIVGTIFGYGAGRRGAAKTVEALYEPTLKATSFQFSPQQREFFGKRIFMGTQVTERIDVPRFEFMRKLGLKDIKMGKGPDIKTLTIAGPRKAFEPSMAKVTSGDSIIEYFGKTGTPIKYMEGETPYYAETLVKLPKGYGEVGTEFLVKGKDLKKFWGTGKGSFYQQYIKPVTSYKDITQISSKYISPKKYAKKLIKEKKLEPVRLKKDLSFTFKGEKDPSSLWGIALKAEKGYPAEIILEKTLPKTFVGKKIKGVPTRRDVLAHELLHVKYPKWTEQVVRNWTDYFSKKGFRIKKGKIKTIKIKEMGDIPFYTDTKFTGYEFLKMKGKKEIGIGTEADVLGSVRESIKDVPFKLPYTKAKGFTLIADLPSPPKVKYVGPKPTQQLVGPRTTIFEWLSPVIEKQMLPVVSKIIVSTPKRITGGVVIGREGIDILGRTRVTPSQFFDIPSDVYQTREDFMLGAGLGITPVLTSKQIEKQVERQRSITRQALGIVQLSRTRMRVSPKPIITVAPITLQAQKQQQKQLQKQIQKQRTTMEVPPSVVPFVFTPFITTPPPFILPERKRRRQRLPRQRKPRVRVAGYTPSFGALFYGITQRVPERVLRGEAVFTGLELRGIPTFRRPRKKKKKSKGGKNK